MELFLCRHERTEHNDKGIVQGQMDSKINEEGENQAKKLRDRLAEENIDKVYSSSMTRAIETAEIVAERHDVEIETTDSLIEPPREEYEEKNRENDSRSQEIREKGLFMENRVW
jgi:broad specificity phosphatase PhoE